MQTGIRLIAAVYTEFRDDIRLALLENVRRAMYKTAATGAVKSVRTQSELSRWKLLRAASPGAADAYTAVLTYFDIAVPEWIKGERR
jgi:hypothetical protein